MSPLSDFASPRSKRVVLPYRNDCKAASESWVPPPKTLVKRGIGSETEVPVCHVERDRLEAAQHIGYEAGMEDRHYEDRNFATGAEWLSWLVGWRAGQSSLKRRLSFADEVREQQEDQMMAKFERTQR